jgi:hypothetical protein
MYTALWPRAKVASNILVRAAKNLKDQLTVLG